MPPMIYIHCKNCGIEKEQVGFMPICFPCFEDDSIRSKYEEEYEEDSHND